MTPAQKFNYYFPEWQMTVKANGWRMEKSRLQIAEESLNAEGLAVLTFARQRAQGAARGVKVDDLRHGCHILALAQDKSSEHLTNAELDRVITLFRLLADPDALQARMDWEAYQRGEDPGALKRLHWVINSVPEAIARKIALDMIHTRSWENATIAQKRTLARRIAQYRDSKKAKQKPVAAIDDPDWNV